MIDTTAFAELLSTITSIIRYILFLKIRNLATVALIHVLVAGPELQ